MTRYFLALVFLLGFTAAVAGSRRALVGVEADSTSFLDTFDGAPGVATPWNGANWEVVANVSDSYRGNYDGMDTMLAHHGAMCGPATDNHSVSLVRDAVFQCNDHIMTAMNSGYGAVYLTPNHMIDLSGEAVIRWDMSTHRAAGRDWVDLWLMPFADQLQIPLDDWLPPYQGEPKNAVHIRMDGASAGGTLFRGSVIRNFEVTGLSGPEWQGYDAWLTEDKARRDTFELRISRTHIKFGMPAYNRWWVDQTVPDLGFDRAVVTWGHHAYNPTKDCTGDCANTWHWDNMSVSPAVPFTLIKSSPVWTNATQNVPLTFASAAPTGAFLKFAGVGANLETSFDNGQTWSAAVRQAQEKDATEHWSTYFSPVPAGAVRVQFRGQATWAGPWMVRDLSVVAQGSGPPPPPTPSPVPTPVPPVTQTVTFDDKTGQNQPLSGQYPSGLISWGSGMWYHSGPYGQFTTKSASFDGSSRTSATFTFLTPRRLVSLRAYNGGVASTVTLACPGEVTKSMSLAAGQLATITTGWNGTCTTVTVTSTNGWDTNFDDLVIDAGP